MTRWTSPAPATGDGDLHSRACVRLLVSLTPQRLADYAAGQRSVHDAGHASITSDELGHFGFFRADLLA